MCLDKSKYNGPGFVYRQEGTNELSYKRMHSNIKYGDDCLQSETYFY